MNYIIFTMLGFCLGSTMFAYWIPKLLADIDICEQPKDHNPGVANAYIYSGFLPGTFALICELGKGFFPVFLSQRFVDIHSFLFSFVLAAPVLGHAFPFFRKDKGGKAITVSFGAVLGLFPELRPFFYLAVFFIFFSVILVASPHSFRSVVTFGLFSLLVILRIDILSVRVGCFIIASIVIFKHSVKYQGEPLQLRLFRHT